MPITLTRVEVCTDCHLAAAGYDEHELGRKFEREPWHLFDGEPGHPTPGDGDPSFGKHPCEACGQPDHGDRHGAHWICDTKATHPTPERNAR